MTIDELIKALGVDTAKVKDASTQIQAFLDGGYVAKAKLDEANSEAEKLRNTLAERDGQLEKLKGAEGNAATLKKQIEDLQKANKEAMDKAAAELKQFRLNSAIELALNGSTHDSKLAATLIKQDKLILNDDGTVTGLKEQVEALKKEKAFLFKDDKGNHGGTNKQGYNPNGSHGSPEKNPFAKETYNLTEQGRMFRENPEQARALASAAGVTI